MISVAIAALLNAELSSQSTFAMPSARRGIKTKLANSASKTRRALRGVKLVSRTHMRD